MSKLFVRHRRDVDKGAERPRFAIVASHGVDVRIYKTNIRQAELNKIAAELGAQVVYLPRGEGAEEGAGRRRREREEEQEASSQ
jgi:hypothetical protein